MLSLFLYLLLLFFLCIKVLIAPLAVSRSELPPTTLLKDHFMITQKLINLTSAMAEFEGWTPQGSFDVGEKAPSRAYRNHNPGNLRSSPFALGTRDDFAFFISDEIGMLN